MIRVARLARFAPIADERGERSHYAERRSGDLRDAEGLHNREPRAGSVGATKFGREIFDSDRRLAHQIALRLRGWGRRSDRVACGNGPRRSG